MAFKCTLDPNEDLNIDVIESNGEFIVRLAVGFDPDSEKTYSISVALSPLPGGCMELSFSVVMYCQHSGDWGDLWDGATTRSVFTSPNDRELIRAALMACIALLVDHVRPEIVSFVTHTPNLPGKALAKFWEVQRIFTDHGYVGGRADPYHGRYVWMMRRKGPI